jgi:hypothetical protein
MRRSSWRQGGGHPGDKEDEDDDFHHMYLNSCAHQSVAAHSGSIISRGREPSREQKWTTGNTFHLNKHALDEGLRPYMAQNLGCDNWQPKLAHMKMLKTRMKVIAFLVSGSSALLIAAVNMFHMCRLMWGKGAAEMTYKITFQCQDIQGTVATPPATSMIMLRKMTYRRIQTE